MHVCVYACVCVCVSVCLCVCLCVCLWVLYLSVCLQVLYPSVLFVSCSHAVWVCGAALPAMPGALGADGLLG